MWTKYKNKLTKNHASTNLFSYTGENAKIKISGSEMDNRNNTDSQNTNNSINNIKLDN